MQDFDVIVIGAGAAGLMAAMAAGRRGRRVLVLEHTDTIGAKILISGGGRCNFTNREIAPERFLSQNPHFARSALARYTARDFIALVEKHGIAHYEKTLGQLFCEGAGAAKKIVAMLVAECEAVGVEIRVSRPVRSVSKADRFTVETQAGPLAAASVVLATGGLSIPKLGATDFAHRTARSFGLPLTEIRPGLVPLTFDARDRELAERLAGVATPALVRAAQGPAFAEAMLFTHRGLSGPAILQASSYWREGEAVTLDFLPGRGAEWLVEAKRTRPKAQAATVLAEDLPQRLAQAFAGDPRPLADWKDSDLRRLLADLKAWRPVPAGTEGYAKAEVTLGGVSTDALDQKTLMAKSVPGLFVVGEAVDVTGWLGGYNFQWAWSSGWAAGMAA